MMLKYYKISDSSCVLDTKDCQSLIVYIHCCNVSKLMACYYCYFINSCVTISALTSFFLLEVNSIKTEAMFFFTDVFIGVHTTHETPHCQETL